MSALLLAALATGLATAMLVGHPGAGTARLRRLTSGLAASARPPGEEPSRSTGSARRAPRVTVRGWRRPGLTGSLARDRRQAVVELCAAVSTELGAGQPPQLALVSAVRFLGDPADLAELLRPALAVAHSGGDVAQELRRVAGLPGAEGLGAVAACWEATQATGSGLSTALGRVGEALRAELEHRRDIETELAGPRASARLLVLLPAVGVLLGLGLGVDPLGWLLGTVPGRIVAAVGVGLDLLGAWWVARLVRVAVDD